MELYVKIVQGMLLDAFYLRIAVLKHMEDEKRNYQVNVLDKQAEIAAKKLVKEKAIAERKQLETSDPAAYALLVQKEADAKAQEELERTILRKEKKKAKKLAYKQALKQEEHDLKRMQKKLNKLAETDTNAFNQLQQIYEARLAAFQSKK